MIYLGVKAVTTGKLQLRKRNKTLQDIHSYEEEKNNTLGW